MHSNKHGFAFLGEVLRLHLGDKLSPLLPTVNHHAPLFSTHPPTAPHGLPTGHSSAPGRFLLKIDLGRKCAVDGRHDVGGLSRNGGNEQRRDPVVRIC